MKGCRCEVEKTRRQRAYCNVDLIENAETLAVSLVFFFFFFSPNIINAFKTEHVQYVGRLVVRKRIVVFSHVCAETHSYTKSEKTTYGFCVGRIVVLFWGLL